MKRIFIAIDISDDAKRVITAHVNALRTDFPRTRVAWVKSENLHLTLKFLGNVNRNVLADISGSVRFAARKTPRFKLRIERKGVFPGKRNPRILWFGIEDETGLLMDLYKRIEARFEKIGIEKEARTFKPHLTIARLRLPRSSRDAAAGHLDRRFDPVEFGVSSVKVYESELRPTGAAYRVVSEHQLS